MNRDLTKGKPETVLWQFCIPLFGSIIFQQLYNIADSFVAGKYIGETALAAVGNSYEITLIFIAFAFGCNIGCSVIVSRLFGAKQYREMKTAISTSLIASAILCLLLMLTGIVGCSRLLTLIHTPDTILGDSRLYLNIYIFGLPFLLFYNVATGIFSALGDSRTPFFFLAFSSTSNILVDILFVSALHIKFLRGEIAVVVYPLSRKRMRHIRILVGRLFVRHVILEIYALQHLLHCAVSLPKIVNVVGRDYFYIVLSRKSDETRQNRLLVAYIMVLYFDIEIISEQRNELFDESLRLLLISL